MQFVVDDGQYPPDPIIRFDLPAAQRVAEEIGHDEIIESGVVDGKVVQARWKRTAAGWVTTSERAWAS